MVADVLKNPRLKATREFYGSAGDKRFALVNSDAWTWPEWPNVAGYQHTTPERTGKRLLRIRVDRYQESGKDNADRTIAVSLVNAGGSANGAVIGAGTVRYTARPSPKGWIVELAEPASSMPSGVGNAETGCP